MSTSTQTAPRPAPPLPARLNTPALLRLWLAGVAVLALLFFLAVRWGVHEHRRGMKAIGYDTAPSILAAQKIRTSLADMHSNAANVLLHPPGKGERAMADYERRRLEATEAVLAAAGNVTYGEEERGPLRKLLDALGRYEASAAQAFLLHRRADEGFLEPHREADRIMSQEILPAADALDKVNRKELDAAYAGARRASLWAVLAVLAAGAALLGALAGVQAFLYRRMRRVVNPALAVATALTLGFLAYVLATFAGQRQALRVAKEDAFESIHALWQARAEAYDANGDESRFLLDPQHADDYERGFRRKADRLLKPPDGTSGARVIEAVNEGQPPAGFEGYLADELRNVTFEGEREAAIATLTCFVRYVQIDGEIRRLERAGKHGEAVALCLGEKPGESNWAFARFDEALGQTLALNQKVFDETVERGLARLGPLDWLGPLAALAAAGLALAGVWPRLREYQAG
jgi:hypothetical protein